MTVDTAALREIIKVLRAGPRRLSWSECDGLDAAADEIDRLRREAVDAEAAYDALYEEQTADLAEIDRLREEQRRDLADVDRFRGNLIRADDKIDRLGQIVRDLANAEIVRGDCEGDLRCVLCNEYDGEHFPECLWRRAVEWVSE